MASFISLTIGLYQCGYVLQDFLVLVYGPIEPADVQFLLMQLAILMGIENRSH